MVQRSGDAHNHDREAHQPAVLYVVTAAGQQLDGVADHDDVHRRSSRASHRREQRSASVGRRVRRGTAHFWGCSSALHLATLEHASVRASSSGQTRRDRPGPDTRAGRSPRRRRRGRLSCSSCSTGFADVHADGVARGRGVEQRGSYCAQRGQRADGCNPHGRARDAARTVGPVLVRNRGARRRYRHCGRRWYGSRVLHERCAADVCTSRPGTPPEEDGRPERARSVPRQQHVAGASSRARNGALGGAGGAFAGG